MLVVTTPMNSVNSIKAAMTVNTKKYRVATHPCAMGVRQSAGNSSYPHWSQPWMLM